MDMDIHGSGMDTVESYNEGRHRDKNDERERYPVHFIYNGNTYGQPTDIFGTGRATVESYNEGGYQDGATTTTLSGKRLDGRMDMDIHGSGMDTVESYNEGRHR